MSSPVDTLVSSEPGTGSMHMLNTKSGDHVAIHAITNDALVPLVLQEMQLHPPLCPNKTGIIAPSVQLYEVAKNVSASSPQRVTYPAPLPHPTFFGLNGFVCAKVWFSIDLIFSFGLTIASLVGAIRVIISDHEGLAQNDRKLCYDDLLMNALLVDFVAEAFYASSAIIGLIGAIKRRKSLLYCYNSGTTIAFFLSMSGRIWIADERDCFQYYNVAFFLVAFVWYGGGSWISLSLAKWIMKGDKMGKGGKLPTDGGIFSEHVDDTYRASVEDLNTNNMLINECNKIENYHHELKN